MRVVPNEIPSFEQLGIPDVLKEVVEMKNGIVLLTGPTGSGKSSTLAAIIDLINRFQDYQHSDDRRSRRVSAPAQELHRAPARVAFGHVQLSPTR